MTDRELLELAAKAAGLPECGWMGPVFVYVKDNTFTEWNPLTDDGDALRLAVKLNIAFGPTDDEKAVAFGRGKQPCVEAHELDPYAATRRAIVRAAAEIGRGAK